MGSPSRPAHAPGPGGRLFTPTFILLALCEFAYFTAAGLAIPLTPLFATEVLGADEVGVGLVVGALALTALLLRPLAGRTSDRLGRRPLLIGGALLYASAMALHALAPDLTALVGLRLVLGLAEAFFFVAGFAALADLAPPGRTGEALSFNSLALYLGIAVGPVIGQLLLDAGGYTIAWLGGAAMALGAALLATLIPETAEPAPRDAPVVPLIHRAAIRPGLLLLTGIAAMAGFFAFVALRAEAIGFDDWSLVLLAFGLIVVGTRILFARLPDRMPPYRLGAVALGLTGVGIIIAALVPSPAGLLVGASVLALGVAFTTPAFFSAVMVRVGAHERGAAMGTMTIAIDLALGAGPLVFGLIAGVAGMPAAFIVGGMVALGGALAATLPARGPRPIDGIEA
jgi:predicted MFS family arabinose efflux permease